MKMKISNYLIVFLMLMGIGMITSCSDDDGEVVVKANTTELDATIAEAEALLDDAVEGSQEGQFLSGSKDILQTAVDAAKAVASNSAVTQDLVDNANVNLKAAIDAFKLKVVAAIAPENLVGHWKFDEGTGTTAGDETSNNFDGAFKTGHAFWGAGDPAWTADRYGNANKAIAFDEGSNIEIPYNTKLNPKTMTLSFWFKQTVQTPIVNNQYMIAMNRWNGYKVNMQSDPKVFFTAATGTAGGPVYDRDHADPVLPQGEWYHAVVTFGGGHMVFYVNGVKTRDWDDTPGDLRDLSANPVNLTFGQDLPTDGYSTNDTDPNYLNWGGYFIGALDEIRIYNTVLTEAQAIALYNSEKP